MHPRTVKSGDHLFQAQMLHKNTQRCKHDPERKSVEQKWTTMMCNWAFITLHVMILVINFVHNTFLQMQDYVWWHVTSAWTNEVVSVCFYACAQPTLRCLKKDYSRDSISLFIYFGIQNFTRFNTIFDWVLENVQLRLSMASADGLGFRAFIAEQSLRRHGSGVSVETPRMRWVSKVQTVVLIDMPTGCYLWWTDAPRLITDATVEVQSGNTSCAAQLPWVSLNNRNNRLHSFSTSNEFTFCMPP